MIVKEYLKKKKLLLLTILISYINMLSIIYLYRVESEKIIYPLIISIITFLVYFVIDFIKFKELVINLKLIKNNVNVDINKIDKNNYIDEKLFYKILKNKEEENKKIIRRNKIEKEQIEDYYISWVHQIKTPISALNLLIEQEKCNNKYIYEQEIFKIENYVNMVLTYLRLNSDVNDLDIEEVDVKKVINTVIKKYSNIFIMKKIKLENNVNLTVISDKKWLEFIFDQLISNALKYNEKQGSISISSTDFEIIIKDSGIGIRKDNLPRIFEKGYTGFNGRKDKKSSGIGLYLVKQSVDLLGHKIKIISEINKGTEVKLIFEKKNINFL